MTSKPKDPVARAAYLGRQRAAKLQAWAVWKSEARPGLRRHAEAVEQCALCALDPQSVAGAFMGAAFGQPQREPFINKRDKRRYHEIKDQQPDRGVAAARFAAAFRSVHRHGPSTRQLCEALGWDRESRAVHAYIVNRLLANGWLTATPPVPWSLRPDIANPAVALLLGLDVPATPGPRRSDRALVPLASHRPD
ncbi:hypothetical protein [Streptomyces sp. NBC_01443]|uniref:hypothetical protein n=1 Tax=Streptomyces sp. NBC_01443 TaxID=2903868 RepID=UPI002256188D|nr:hypothetical protein [Streptomyces sp. NBC_01443]MCX4625156.1 hypothetical protein [Streptomyces sp. NBC_01443]MCX4633521.1 hypothetical protein [Streptomyces sp. NBC_01443]